MPRGGIQNAVRDQKGAAVFLPKVIMRELMPDDAANFIHRQQRQHRPGEDEMGLAGKVVNGGVGLGRTLGLVQMHRHVELERRFGRLEFTKHVGMNLRIHPIGILQEGEPEVVGVILLLAACHKPVPDLPLLLLQPPGEGIMLGEGDECARHEEA